MKDYFLVTIMLDGTTQIAYKETSFVVDSLTADDIAGLSKVFDGAFPWIRYQRETK